MLNIIVIGGSGFIGTRLVRRLKLKKAFTVKILDKSPSKAFPDSVVLADVTSPHQLMDSISDNSVIVHLAAEHRDDVLPKSLYCDVNVGGATNLCNAAKAKGVKTIIFTSTVAVYGFAPIDTDESGKIAPFNAYGRTKFEAEKIFIDWQSEAPSERTLVIVRPTVVFGEQNRGNVYKLLRQISSGRFLMVGDGLNRKSLAYVENVAAFLEYSLSFKPGIHTFNYTDKPDFTMNQLVEHVNRILGRMPRIKLKLPYWLGLLIGRTFDLLGCIFRMKFIISSIRVKKFCVNSVYESAIDDTGFIPPVPVMEAIEKTVKYEFIESRKNEQVFFTE
jgi:nucleoside-diphosphate-sugar epimerase